MNAVILTMTSDSLFKERERRHIKKCQDKEKFAKSKYVSNLQMVLY